MDERYASMIELSDSEYFGGLSWPSLSGISVSQQRAAQVQNREKSENRNF